MKLKYLFPGFFPAFMPATPRRSGSGDGCREYDVCR